MEQSIFILLEWILHVINPVSIDNELIGSIMIVANMNDLYSRAYRHLFVTLLILIASSVIALGISYKLQQYISEPILNLSQIASKVANEDYYSVRVHKDTNDEIGELADNFNKMITRIQEHEIELKHINSGLENRIRERTHDLRKQIEKSRDAANELHRHLELLIKKNRYKNIINIITQNIHQSVDLNKVLEYTT